MHVPLKSSPVRTSYTIHRPSGDHALMLVRTWPCGAVVTCRSVPTTAVPARPASATEITLGADLLILVSPANYLEHVGGALCPDSNLRRPPSRGIKPLPHPDPAHSSPRKASDWVCAALPALFSWLELTKIEHDVTDALTAPGVGDVDESVAGLDHGWVGIAGLSFILLERGDIGPGGPVH